MLKKFSNLILIAGILVSASAGFYSVYGLSKLFSGASIAVIVMAGSLELSKLIIAGSLHQYWGTLNAILRNYLIFAVLILVMITSSGIYGFLSDAYQQTADKDKIVQSKLNLLKVKRDRFQTQMLELKTEREQVVKSISDLRTSISTDNQYQTIDKRTGQVLTQIQTTSKKSVNDQLNLSTNQSDQLFSKIENLNDSISTYDIAIIEMESKENVSELGPLKYLSNLTGKPMDQIVNWFLILLMVVFDPLAIALILLWLFSIESKPKTPVELPTPILVPVPEPVVKPKRKYTRRTPVVETPPDAEISLVSDLNEVSEASTPPTVEVALETQKKPRKPRARKIVDTNLTSDIATHLEQSLKNKKKV